MICKVRKTIEAYNMPVRGSKICAALSGGADSMALLNALNELSSELDFTLSACHVNHGIRGEEADRDEAFVTGYCEEKGIPLKVLHANVPELAKEKGMGLEECGRAVRYEFFASFENCLIATAHTLSDRCETLILNETRGASLKGLASIPAVRGNIIRPLIDCTRQEIEDYCSKNNIPFVTDSTNSDDNYARNRIRLNVIPELKKINPAFEQSAARLMQTAGEDEEFLSSCSKTILDLSKTEKGYKTEFFRNEHPAIKRRIISQLIKNEAGFIPELVHIRMVEGVLQGGKTEILKDTVIEVKNGFLRVNPEMEKLTGWQCDFSDFTAETPSGNITAKIFNKNDLPPQQNVHNMVLDFECIVGKCIIRNRRQGDRMKCAGSSCTKTLKKLFNEKHLEGRNSLAVLCDEKGILWVQGIGCADRCKITDKTEKILLMGEGLEND